ncbi:MAG: CARDB domain-containing protein, partial [Candidatus Saliniplasma sp.]
MLQRNIFDDEDAVSEVVGTILILSITVVLFSSIFATVSYLDTPDRKTYIDMEAEFQRDDYNLSISHQGGRSLDMIDTSFYIVIGGDSIRYEGGDVELDGDDDTWDMNEDVVIDLDGFDWEDIEAQGIPIAEVMVSDNANNHLVWSTEVSLSEAVYRPRLRDVGVYYEPEWKDHVEKGDEVELYARVSHPNESASNLDVTVDLSDLNDYNGIEEMEYDGNTMGSEFNKEINITSDEEERTYGLEVIVEDSNGHFAKDYIKLNVGPQGDVRERPDIIVDENKIEFNPTSPTSGRSLRVDAVIENDGGSAARVNVTIKDSHPKGGKHVTNISDIRVAAGGGHDISATWDVIGSGTHNISINVTAVESPGGDNYRDLDEVIAYKEVSVKPSILVIDDVPSSTIEASIMKNALGGTDFSYDFYNVSGPEADGPSDETIEGHDLLIWLTGGAEENTLTQNDIDNLKEYLDEGNNLWLIGEHVLEDVQNIDTSFRDNYLGINGFDDEEGAPNEDYAEGVGILENLSLPTSDNFAEADGGYITTGDADPMMEDGEGGDNIGSSFEGDEGFRSAAHSVQLRSIQSGRTNIAYRVIKWLANMESVSGSDVAISEQSFSTRTPMYQEEVEVTATVRNNGPQNETVDVRLYVNDRLDTSQRETVTLTRDGGEQDVTFTWTAEPIGSHDLVVKADPFNRIEDETNFKNNDITYTDFDTNINVQYSVLIVDATHADGAANETEFAEDQIDSLGYAYDYFEIEDGDRPSEELMSKYNSVKWIVGNTSYDEDNNQYPLSDEDIENIQDYLDDNTFVSFYLEGHRIIKDLVNEGGAIKTGFITNYLGIDYNEINILEQVPEELHGVTDETLSGDNYTHGINYLIDSEREDFYGFETTDQGIPIFTDQDGNTVGARYHNEEDEYRTAFSGVGLPHIAGPNVEEEWYEDFNGPVNTSAGAAREEYTYLLTKWFGNEDERVELRVSDVDIEIDDDHPTLGRSYLLTASVQNVGFKDSGALVRFKDEDNLIASDSIHVSADGSHTAEVSWRPSFAGMRSLRVLVDPLQNVAEIGNDPDDPNDIDTMGFNNHATIDRRVYYFWDDMEDGDDKWDHEATLANINGEQPLEYLSNEYEEVYTDVASEWDEDMSHNVSMTDQFSHSDPNSHWMAEPMAVNDTVQEEVPVDVVMAIDTSGSMHWDDEGYDVGSDDPESRMYQAVGAAIGFIEDMNEEDKLEVWTFHPEGGYDPDPYQYLPFAEMNDGNKQDFIDALNDIRYQDGDWPDGPNGNTPYYDTLGHAIQSASEINEGEDNDRLEFVIGLADGEDNTGDEYDQTGEWGEGGLLNAPPMVYNIGFVGENLHPDDSTYPLAPYWDDNHDGNPVIEEEMFHVGNSTPSDEWQNKYGNRT